MIRLDDVVQELLKHHPDADVAAVRRAYVFSAAAHRGQTRRSGEPYLVHPVEVSHIVARLQMDSASVCAALLHDTVEDTVATVGQVEGDFGKDVAFLVQGLTKLEKINFTSAEEAQAENFRKMLIAMSRDLRVILVKLADRLHNMQTLNFMTADKQKRIAQETLDIYAPLANRLGVSWIKVELEDLCFKYLYPDEYSDLAKKVEKTRQERHAYIGRVVKELKTELERHQLKAEVTGRPKHLWSIRQKMKASGRDFHSLYDIQAFRVVIEKVTECYETLGLVHTLWRPIPGRFKDYIALPKDNNYQSLHTAVIGPESERVEIQIRTQSMHDVAQYGVAAHCVYKETQYGAGKNQSAHMGWLNQLLEWQRDLNDPQEFLNTVKGELKVHEKEVYVFTPKGEVYSFPRGATPLDFAYAIHTDLGHECTGARVSGVQVGLRYELKNGDIVEIQRATGSKPKPDWIKLAQTGRAKSKIRAFMRQEANARSFQIGTELLEKELRRYNMGLAKLRKTGRLDAAVQAHKYINEREFLMALGYGKASVEEILPELLPPEMLKQGPKEGDEDAESVFKRLVRKVLPKSKGGLSVDGLEGIATHFPRCCQPVHGDDIVGFVTRGRGVTIHRRDCPRVLDYEPVRRVDVHWDSTAKQLRPVQICVTGQDAPGLLAQMSQSFHNAGVNITAVNCRTTADRRAINHFTVLVNDLEQLNRVMKMIERIEGVSSVERLST